MSLEPASETALIGSNAPETSKSQVEGAEMAHPEALTAGEATDNDTGAAKYTDSEVEAAATVPSQAAFEADKIVKQQEGQQEENHLRDVSFAPPMQEQEANGQLMVTQAPELPVLPAAMPIHESELALPLTDTAQSKIAETSEQPVPAPARQQADVLAAPAAAMTLPEQPEASSVADDAAAAPTTAKQATAAAKVQPVANGDSVPLPEPLQSEGPAAPVPASIAAAPAPLLPEPAAIQLYPTPEAAAAIALAAEQVAAALLGDLSSSMDSEAGGLEASQAAHGQPPAPAGGGIPTYTYGMPLLPQLAPWAQHPALHPYTTAVETAWLGGASSLHPPPVNFSPVANNASTMVPADAGGNDPALRAALAPTQPLTSFPVAHLTEAVDSGLQTMRHRIRTAVERENELRLETELAAVEREALAQARALAEANAEVERGARRAAEAEAQRALAELHEQRQRVEAEALQLRAVAAGLERQVAGLRAELADEVARRQAAERQLERQARRVARPLQALVALAADPRVQAWGGALPATGVAPPPCLALLQQSAEQGVAVAQAAAADRAQPPAASWLPQSHTTLSGTQSPQRLMQDVRDWLTGGWAPACTVPRSPPQAHQPPAPMPQAHQPAPPALKRQPPPVRQRSQSPARRPMSAAARPRTGWDFCPAWRDCSGSSSSGRRPEPESANPPSPSRPLRQPGASSQAQQALGELSAGLEQLRRSCSPRSPPPPTAAPVTQQLQQQQQQPPLQQWMPAFTAPGSWGYMALPPSAQLGVVPGLLSPAYHDAALPFPPSMGGMPISGTMAAFGACPSITAYWGGAGMPAGVPDANGIMPTGDPLTRPSTATVQAFQPAQKQQAWPTHPTVAAGQQRGDAQQQQHWSQPAAAPPAHQRPSTPGMDPVPACTGPGRPEVGCMREPFLVPGLEGTSRPRSAAARSKARAGVTRAGRSVCAADAPLHRQLLPTCPPPPLPPAGQAAGRAAAPRGRGGACGGAGRLPGGEARHQGQAHARAGGASVKLRGWGPGGDGGGVRVEQGGRRSRQRVCGTAWHAEGLQMTYNFLRNRAEGSRLCKLTARLAGSASGCCRRLPCCCL